MTGVCPVPTSTLAATAFTPRVHYLLSGTFNTLFLYILAFSPYSPSGPTLSIHKKYPAEGPHQFIALSQDRARAYATTWALPPSLSSWEVLQGGKEGVRKINTIPISATGSYLAVSPESSSFSPPGPRIYQAGGPVAQSFVADRETGGFSEQVQEVVYLDGGVEELADPKTDKTRVALRYGSHAVDIDPVLERAGRDSIFIYAFSEDGTLKHLNEVPSNGHKGHEGPRHSIPSKDGQKLYVVTEHTSYLDVYTVLPSHPFLSHSQRLSVIPPSQHSTRPLYRGDTLRLSADSRRLYVTTRGKTSAQKGWVVVFSLAEDGSIVENAAEDAGYGTLSRYETKTSGGKANAIEVFPFWPSSSTSTAQGEQAAGAKSGPEGCDWIVLTDDEQGCVSVLEWRNEWKELREVASVRLGVDSAEGDVVEKDEEGTGASHAVWLS
ncbi:hypothetical protein JCM11641_002265 [Rhodosporidiobolus odoratus]